MLMLKIKYKKYKKIDYRLDLIKTQIYVKNSLYAVKSLKQVMD